MNGRITDLPRATQAHAGQRQVNDAGALAPVVFSGEEILGTCKIRTINEKEGPYPPKSTMANTMVVLVFPESASNYQFETQQLQNPKHGIVRFGRSTLLAIAQIVYMESHEHKKGIRIN